MLQWMIDYVTKRCFRQGEHAERKMLLISIIKAVDTEYHEDNWYTKIYWLVEEILRVDPDFTKDRDINAVEKGMVRAIRDALQSKQMGG